MDVSKRDKFIANLDQIIFGTVDIGPIEDQEIASMLQMVRMMVAAGSNINSQTKEALWKRIMDQMPRQGVHSLPIRMQSSQSDELDDEDLEYVAAGMPRSLPGEACPVCGSTNMSSKGKCPFCKS